MPRTGRGENPISREQWLRLETLLAAALEMTAEARPAFLDRECADDAVLRAELDSLLAAHANEGPLDHPPPWSGRETNQPRNAELAVGTIVSHYQIQAPLGRGGMGVVYRARDLRLERTVALKFLPRALSGDAHTKQRFLVEARAAAGLEHANVCTIHEIDEADDGQLFLAMAFVDGESLRQRLDRGALPVIQAIEVAAQVAAALECAHRHGVVHRDVKPANVMIGTDGVVKLVDFGIAKLAGLTLTGTRATPGTAAYMSPEQVNAEGIDARTDVWSLGVVLYEMLAGQRPFGGETDMAMLHAITHASPPRLRSLRSDVSEALERIVARALMKARDKRFASAAEMRDALLATAKTVAGETPRPRRRWALLPAVGIAALVAFAPGIAAWRSLATRRAAASLVEIERLAQAESFVEAYAVGTRARRWLRDDTTLHRLMEIIEDHITVVSQPAGAQVWLRRVGDDGTLEPDSSMVGSTPLHDLRVARADYHLTIEKPGFVRVQRIASSALNRAEATMGIPVRVDIEVQLFEPERVPEGMVFVPGSEYKLVGREAPTRVTAALDDYYIDTYEVTNEQFREFIVAGGYSNPQYWQHGFVRDGEVLSRGEAMALFVDRTGLHGPREWSNQEYPAGAGDHPVTGVTWYEAAAYAEFAGKRLPTIFEWEKAARDGLHTRFEQIVLPWGLADPARGIARRANFGTRGTTAAGSHPAAISPYGAHDMAGNVEEWIANATGDQFFITGGAWDDPMYVFSNFAPVSGFHASSSLGFRCARDATSTVSGQGGFEIRTNDRTPEYRPVDETTYRSLLRHYDYDRGDLNAEIVERVVTPDWTREAIRIDGPWNDRTLLYLYLPVRGVQPFQIILFVPGANTFLESTLPAETERIVGPHVKAGRAVVAVMLKGMNGRPWDSDRVTPSPSSVQFRQELVLHATEQRRALDYVETRSEIDTTRIAYVAFSFGSGSRLPFAAVDPRLRSVVLIGGGIDERVQPTVPEANSINFAPHIRAPKLLLNGRYDEEHAWDARALPLWELLREPKRLALVEGGHLPPAEVRVPVINNWLDETLGTVQR